MFLPVGHGVRWALAKISSPSRMRRGTMTDRSNVAVYYSLPFFLAFALSVVMLLTDANLRTDFGAMGTGFYLHWDVVLATALADLVGAVLLLLVRSRTSIKGGVVGSGLLLAVFVGDILTYKEVGFSSASAFAQYLLGITYYGGDIRYLYDVLLVVYAAAFVAGLATLARTHGPARTRASSEEPLTPPG